MLQVAMFFLPYVEIDIQHETKMPTRSREKLICKIKGLLPAFQVLAMLPLETQLPLCRSRSALLFRLHEAHKTPQGTYLRVVTLL